MRYLVLLALAVSSVFLMSSGWRTDFDRAKADAAKAHKLILLRFSGSDWCVPCIRMEKDVFSKDTFVQYAASALELVNVDFPRAKKNQPDASTERQNQALAGQYNPDGRFPYLVLTDAGGNVLKVWDGYNGEKAGTLIQQIRSYAHAN